MLALERRNLILEKLQTERRVVASSMKSQKKQYAGILTSLKRKGLPQKAMAEPLLMKM